MRVHDVACEEGCCARPRLEVADEEEDRVLWVSCSVDEEEVGWECVWDVDSSFMGISRDVMSGALSWVCKIEEC